MSAKPVVIYRATDPHHAHLLRNILADYDIIANVSGDALLNAVGEVAHSREGFPVVVTANDADLAHHIADAFQRHVLQANETDDEIADLLTPPWQDWPVCPRCKARQTTVCPLCGEHGDDFSLAEWQGRTAGSETPSDILLVCPTCDEVFKPQFYRDCPWCGHHFGTGLEPQVPSDELNVPVTIGGALAILAALLYLWLITST